MTLALEVNNLSKVYRGNVVALDGVSFSIAEGSFFALLGPNGAGKSTTIGIITSLVNKSSGQVRVFGLDLDHDRTRIKQLIGVVPQEFNFNVFEKTGNIIRNQAGYFGIPPKEAEIKAAELLKKTKIWYKRRDTSRSLSGGMKRRLMLARSLVNNPKLLVLDEPTTGADIEIRYEIWEYLKELKSQGTTIILTTHYLEEVEKLCDHVAIIDKGKIIENSTLNALLARLKEQSFLVTTDGKFNDNTFVDAEAVSTHYRIVKVDAHTLEITISDVELLGDALNNIRDQGVKIKNISNKTNRVEQLFLKLTRS